MLDSYLPPIPDDAVPTGQRGELGERLVATLIDAVPVIIIHFALVILSFIIAFIPILNCLGGCVIFILHFVVGLGYWFWFVPNCVHKHGASIGKKMQKLRVVPLGEPAGRLSMGSAVVRSFSIYPLGVISLIILAVKGEEHISLGDMLSKSEVIKVDR